MVQLKRIQQLDKIAWLVSVTVAGASAALILRTLWLLDRGFDFTDQAFYLMLAQRPGDFELAYGFFGYGLHPLYQVLGGSISGMERAGAAILVILGGALGIIVSTKTRASWYCGVQIVAVSASLPLTFYLLWIPVPGYNWIALVGGILLIAILLLLGNENCSAAMAAVAAVLAVLSRPQTALGYGALYLTAIFFVIPSARERFMQVLRATCATMIAAVTFAAFLPISTIANQIRAYIAIFGATHPNHYSFIDQQLEFAKSAWPVFLSGTLFIVLFTLSRHTCGELHNEFDTGCPGGHFRHDAAALDFAH